MIHIKVSSHANRQQGFTLIEVLVTMIILAIGLLGLASLQSAGMQYNYSAYTRSQASILANDIFDRMRANRTAAIANQYSATLGTAVSAPSTSCVGSSANCSAAQMATYDVYVWKQSLLTQLAQGDGGITILDDAGTSLFQVEVRWLDNRLTDSAVSTTENKVQSFTIVGEL